MKANLFMQLTTFALLPLLSTNCATIFGQARAKEVTLNSNPQGARVTVTNNQGTLVHEGVTPTTATLKRGAGYFRPARYKVEYTKKGLPQHNLDIGAQMNGWYLGNLVFGGLLGLVIVDPATGAMWTLDDEYSVNLGSSAITANSPGSVQIVNRSEIPSEWEPHLVAVN